MKPRINLWPLVAAQVICIALGCWVQHRYTIAELNEAASRQIDASSDPSTWWNGVLEQALPETRTVSAITFLWTAGLAGAVMYLIVSRADDRRSRSRVAP